MGNWEAIGSAPLARLRAAKARECGVVPQGVGAPHRGRQHGDALAERGLSVHAVVQRELSAVGGQRVREAQAAP